MFPHSVHKFKGRKEGGILAKGGGEYPCPNEALHQTTI